MITITFNRDITLDELKEVKTLAEHQETADKYTNTSIHINGNDAEIDVKINEYGDIIVL